MSKDSLKQGLIADAEKNFPGGNLNLEAAHALGSIISRIFAEDKSITDISLHRFGYQDLEQLRADAMELSKEFQAQDLPYDRTTPPMLKNQEILNKLEARWKASR